VSADYAVYQRALSPAYDTLGHGEAFVDIRYARIRLPDAALQLAVKAGVVEENFAPFLLFTVITS
jgi:hypothetical protein